MNKGKFGVTLHECSQREQELVLDQRITTGKFTICV